MPQNEMEPALRSKISAFLLALAAGLCIVGFFASPARADMRVCNDTGGTVSIALGYRSDRGWQSEGWWVTGPNECAVVFAGPLDARFYYIYAVDDSAGGAWAGQVYMCTRDDSFTIFGVEDCLARGYERTGFLEIDTESRTEWTLRLTGANLTSASSQ